MRVRHLVPLLALTLVTSGCYTTVVDTGRRPSGRTFRDDWVMGFASGLLMVERVNAGRHCAAGVARVKTETSLANFVVQTVTAGILSPRTVEVTCAAGGPDGAGWAAEPTFRWEHEHEHEHGIDARRHREFERRFHREMEREWRHGERTGRARVRLRLSGDPHFH